jgi:hypothetical protein
VLSPEQATNNMTRFDLLVLVLSPVLVLASLAYLWLYVTNHEREPTIIREVKSATADYRQSEETVQRRLRAEISGVEVYRRAALFLAAAGIALALSGRKRYSHESAPRWQRVLRHSTLFFGALSLVLSLLRV